MPEPRVTIKIPRPLYERIRASIEGSGFSSPTDFIVYVLRDVMSGAGHKADEPELTREEADKSRAERERATAELGFDGHAHGGLGLGESRETRSEMVEAAQAELPPTFEEILIELGGSEGARKSRSAARKTSAS